MTAMSLGRGVQRFVRAVQRPHYAFNPVQLARRARRDRYRRDGRAQLAWGMPIGIRDGCLIAQDILNVGVFELMLAETLYRLLEPGELAMDVGSNIGQNASLMALAAGPRGRVIALEPHPVIWTTLLANVDLWSAFDIAPIQALKMAASSAAGTGVIYEDDTFGSNSGSARLVHDPGEPASGSYPVTLTTLDCLVPADASVGVLKIDVEGYEIEVLRGGTGLLADRRVRDIVFEEHETGRTPVIALLEDAGYRVFLLGNAWAGPVLKAWDAPRTDTENNLLATLDPDRAFSRLRQRGWRCLRVRALPWRPAAALRGTRPDPRP